MWRPDPEVEKLCLKCKDGSRVRVTHQPVHRKCASVCVCLTQFLLSIFCVLGFRVTIRVVLQESEHVRRTRSSVCVCAGV